MTASLTFLPVRSASLIAPAIGGLRTLRRARSSPSLLARAAHRAVVRPGSDQTSPTVKLAALSLFCSAMFGLQTRAALTAFAEGQGRNRARKCRGAGKGGSF